MNAKPEMITPDYGKMVLDANNVVQVVSESLKTKPEVDFTPEEHYARGLAGFADGDYTTALASFESALSGLPPDAAAVDTARYVLAKGVTFGKLGRPNEEIAAYDDIDTRFGTDTMPAVREIVIKALFNKGVTLIELKEYEKAIAIFDKVDQRFDVNDAPGVFEQVAKARNGVGFSQLMLAKTYWKDEKQRGVLLNAAKRAFERALNQCTDDDRAMVLGNLGYVLHLNGEQETARTYTLKSLTLGDDIHLNRQRADAQQHRVEPEDTNYEQLVDELWETLNDAPTDGN